MKNPSFTNEKHKSFIKITTACFLIFVSAINLFAQYKGAPVKKDRLIKALRSKQLQTRDIVTIINSNGVNFAMTEEVKKALIAAGARPEVIRAVSENPRFSAGDSATAKSIKRKPDRRAKPTAPDYDELLEQAMHSYREKRNQTDTVRYLKTAIKLKPGEPAAYQMLGFVNLYGLRNLPQAEQYMRQAIENGGSAVFRVYHDDRGSFTERCTGSLYISPESIRFESDDNIHTFETSTINIDKIKLDRETSKTWKNHTIFKVYLKLGKTEARFRFAPLTANEEESKMVARFVESSKGNINLPEQTTGSFKNKVIKYR